MGERKVVKTTCRMCGTLCGIDAHIEDNKVVHIEGNKDSVLNKGRICIKGSSAVTWLNHPDRLYKPLKKMENGEFVEIEMEQAMDEIAEKLTGIQKQYGDNAIGVWKGEGIDFAQQEELARRWIHSVGSPNYFSNDTQCFASRYLSFNLVYGCWPQADYDNSKMIINWGTNAPISHSYWMQQINNGRETGATLVVIDTRYTDIARQADIFIKIKPGTDAALAWGIIREMIKRDEIDHEFIENFTVGFDELKAYAEEYTFEKVEEITGVDPKYITKMVDAIAKARPQVSSWAGTGLEHQSNGVNSIRSVTMIDALAGAIDRKGGMKTPAGFGMRGLTIYDEKPLLELEPIGAKKYPVLYERRQECHTLMLMDQVLSSDPYPFKGLVMTAANPVLTNANTGKVEAALEALDLLVVKDLFLTETAKMADYVLPAASYLEREEVFCNSGKQAAFITGKYIDNGLQTEYEMFKGLAERMGAGDYFPWADDHELTEWLLEPTGYTVADLKTNPSGFIFGEYEYEKHRRKAANGEKPFNTPTGKVELFSEYLVEKGIEGLNGVPEYHDPAYMQQDDPAYPYLMITGARVQKFFHGRYRNIEQLRKADPNGCLEIHPEDAKELGIVDGEKIKISSRVGSIETFAKIVHEKEIIRGAVQHTHGYVNQNINYLTYDDVTDPISGFPALKSIQIKIEKL